MVSRVAGVGHIHRKKRKEKKKNEKGARVVHLEQETFSPWVRLKKPLGCCHLIFPFFSYSYQADFIALSLVPSPVSDSPFFQPILYSLSIIFPSPADCLRATCYSKCIVTAPIAAVAAASSFCFCPDACATELSRLGCPRLFCHCRPCPQVLVAQPRNGSEAIIEAMMCLRGYSAEWRRRVREPCCSCKNEHRPLWRPPRTSWILVF